MYGMLGLGESVEIGDTVFKFVKMGDGARYIRESPRGGFTRDIYGIDKLSIHPSPPIYHPLPGMLFHVYIRLNTPLYISPGYEMDYSVEVLSDVAVSYGETETSYLDVVTYSIPKMAAYGGSADGILCRYLPIADREPSLKIPFKISNKCREPVTLSKIVFPVSYLDIYFKPKTLEAISNDIEVQLECDVAVVKKGSFNKEGYIKIPIEAEEILTEKLGIDITSVKRFFEVEQTFIMDRGL